MPSSPTTRTRLEKQQTGENLNSWGDRLNQNGMDLIDEAIAGVETIALTGDIALNSVNYTTDQARNFGLRFTGTGGVVTIPGVEKVYAVRNDTSNTVTLKTSAGLGAVLPAGDAAVVICDGTNCRFASVTEARVAALIAAAGLSGSLPAVAGQDGKFLRAASGGILWDSAYPDTVPSKGLVLRAKRDGSGTEWASPGEAAVRSVIDYTFPAIYTTPRDVAVALTPTLSLHFVSSASALFVAAADSAAGTVGTPTSIDTTTNAPKHAFRLSDTQALVFWVDGGGNNKAAVLTVSGTAVSVGTAASTATAFLSDILFSDRPLIAPLTSTQFVVLYGSGGNALLVTVSGTSVTIGAAAAVTASPKMGLACYRVSDTQALALYLDDSGTAGAPYSLRGVVLTVNGTGLTVGTGAGINDVIGSTYQIPSARLTDTKYIIPYGNYSDSSFRAVVATVTGGSVSFGAPLTIEATGGPFDINYGAMNANRFHPLAAALDASRMLVMYGRDSGGSRHVVLTESGGTLTAGPILYSAFSVSTVENPTGGGMFAPRSDGALIINSTQSAVGVSTLAISGTAPSIAGTVSRNGMGLQPAASLRFALSGGVVGVSQMSPDASSPTNMSRNVHLFRYVPNAAPVYLGEMTFPDSFWQMYLPPLELAPNRAAFLNSAKTGATASTNFIRLHVLEFAS